MSALNNNLFSRIIAYRKVSRLIRDGEYAGNTVNLKRYTNQGSNAAYWNGKYREHLEALQQREYDEEKKVPDEMSFTTETVNFGRHNKLKNFIHNVDLDIGYNQLQGRELKERLNLFLMSHQSEIGNFKVSIQLNGFSNSLNEDREYTPIRLSNPIGSAYLPIDQTINNFMVNKLGPKINEYRTNYLHIDKLIISYIIPNASIIGHSNFKLSKHHNLTEDEINKIYNNISENLKDTATRTIEQGLKKFYITDPRTTEYNCLFHSLAVCINYKNNINYLLPTTEGDKIRKKGGENLKYLVKPANKCYSDNQTIQEISNYKNCIIEVYNNLFQLTDTIKPKDNTDSINKRNMEIKTYKIQRNGNHCLSLILRSDIDKLILTNDSYKSFTYNTAKLEEKLSEPNLLDTPIKKKANHDKLNLRIGTYDLETTPDLKGNHITYAAGLAYYDDNNEIQAVQKWGIGNCIKDLFKYMYDNEAIFNNRVMYGHNGGKYDIPILLREAFITSDIWRIDGKKCVELGGRWISFEIYAINNPKFRIIFRDSMAILGGSLKKLTTEMDVLHKKLDETINHNDINLINYNSFGDVLKEYLNNDVMGLLEVMTLYIKDIYDNMNIDATKCYTGASLSKKNYFKNYYDPNKTPIYSLSDEHDEFIRESYYGGRNECFKLGNYEADANKKLYYMDFTSLYPSVGRKKLPYGEPKDTTFNNINDEPIRKLPKGYFGFVKCKIRTKDRSALPKHCIYKDSRLIFPIFDEWETLTIFTPEIDYAIYEYEFIKGVSFNSSNFLDKFFTDGFNKKAKAKKDHQPALTASFKTVINSGYGFWALRTKDRDGLKIFDETNRHGFIEYLNTNKLLSVSDHGPYTFARVINDLDIKDYNIAIGAAISSYARIRLHELITAIRAKGGIVYYCDTDSVITNLNIADYPDIQRNFQFDYEDEPGAELGSLKDEGTELVEDILRKIRKPIYNNIYNDLMTPTVIDRNDPIELRNIKHIISDKFDTIINKELKELRRRAGGHFNFYKLTLSGCKQYSLILKIIIDDIEYKKEINKLKGYSKSGVSDKPLNYETMAALHNGGKIKQTVKQFRNPLTNYTNNNKNLKNMVKTVELVKSFRCIYTKGNIGNDGNITPLIIGNAPTIAVVVK
jgi:hypothetical protein